MPIRFCVDLERRILIAEVDGAVDDDDLLDYGERLARDPEVKYAVHELVDLSGVALDSAVSAEGVRRLADFWRDREGVLQSTTRVAIVAPNDAAFGMARMYQLIREGGPDEIQVFRERPEAEAWLTGRGPDPGREV